MGDDHRDFRYTFGIEEEFFLAHPKSRMLATSVPRSFMHACRRRFGNAVAPELLHSQIELVSPVFERCDDAYDEMMRLRRGIADIAVDKNLRLMASGTHPIAAWGEQSETPKNRYRGIMEDFQIVARRNVLCGLHVHVAVPGSVDRVALMNRLMPWLPALLALSTSSPFWNRAATGLLSYRQAAYDEWPRTGIPDHFESEAEYERFVQLLVAGGAARDSSYLWWAIRPAARYPTLELRICDACTRLADSVAIASLYRCLVRMLVRRPDAAPAWTPFTRRLIDENRWRAKRFGLDAELIALDGGTPVACRETLSQLLADVAEDAEALDCTRRLDRVRALMAEGTSAHMQLAIYRGRRSRGDTPYEALRFVVDWLVAATVTEPAEKVPEAAAGAVLPQSESTPTA
ncbi:glutamate---cysteine ligase / carboxylate-amine ligase [Burkholderiales bacterium]|nr:glutamate---cysteine ligase / carboxylate-amine ligase [Burkholderiales bacterium]